MTAAADIGADARGVSAAQIERAAVGLVLAIQSGALLPLLASGNGELDEPARAMLRLSVLPVYAITLVLVVRHFRQVLMAAQRSWPLVALVALPMLSVLWSISPTISLRRAVALILTLLLSQVIAVMFTPRQLMWTVARVMGICLAGSLAMMIVDPTLAFMPGETALRGIYINKNVLGWAAALATVAGAIMACDRIGRRRGQGLSLGGLGVVCLVLSHSSTSLIAAIAALTLAGFHVLMARARGLARILLLLSFLVSAGFLLVFLGTLLVPVLDALGKDATLTGRVPLWHLVDARIAERPWLGYGYQTFWTEGSSDAWVIWSAIEWQSPHAHNGYRDVLLNVGLAGLVPLAAVTVQAFRRGARLSMAWPAQGWLWPNAFLGQSLIINLSESSLLFHNDLQWILTGAVVTMFAIHARDRSDPARGQSGTMPGHPL